MFDENVVFLGMLDIFLPFSNVFGEGPAAGVGPVYAQILQS